MLPRKSYSPLPHR